MVDAFRLVVFRSLLELWMESFILNYQWRFSGVPSGPVGCDFFSEEVERIEKWGEGGRITWAGRVCCHSACRVVSAAGAAQSYRRGRSCLRDWMNRRPSSSKATATTSLSCWVTLVIRLFVRQRPFSSSSAPLSFIVFFFLNIYFNLTNSILRQFRRKVKREENDEFELTGGIYHGSPILKSEQLLVPTLYNLPPLIGRSVEMFKCYQTETMENKSCQHTAISANSEEETPI